jgi:serine/threonine-protein kinase
MQWPGPSRRSARQARDAIDHAHARGVVHRDLKPDNMILVTEGDGLERLKVLDFGVAKIVDPQYADSILSANDGWVLGTPAYMAPEQLTGVGDDTRIDIYSYGCVAFRMLTGTMPFTGRTMDVCHAHIHERPPSLRARAPSADIPIELEDLVLRCMEKDPRMRFQTGGDIVRALESVPLPSAAWSEWERAKTIPG